MLNLYADTADRTLGEHMLRQGIFAGLTTNPALLRAAGVKPRNLPALGGLGDHSRRAFGVPADLGRNPHRAGRAGPHASAARRRSGRQDPSHRRGLHCRPAAGPSENPGSGLAVAAVVSFLASKNSAYVTGQPIVVDGDTYFV